MERKYETAIRRPRKKGNAIVTLVITVMIILLAFVMISMIVVVN